MKPEIRIGWRCLGVNLFTSTAQLLWLLCDGSRCLGEVAKILRQEYPNAGHQIDIGLVYGIRRLADRRSIDLCHTTANGARPDL